MVTRLNQRCNLTDAYHTRLHTSFSCQKLFSNMCSTRQSTDQESCCGDLRPGSAHGTRFGPLSQSARTRTPMARGPSPVLDFFQEVQAGHFDNRLNLLARHSRKIIEESL